MKRHIVYIITDSNRAYLEIGYCTDTPACLQGTHDISPVSFGRLDKLNSIVYIEVFESKEKALSYHNTLRHFTRMQREKLIRLKNPNWLNLSISPSYRNKIDNKKVAVYA